MSDQGEQQQQQPPEVIRFLYRQNSFKSFDFVADDSA